MPNAHDSQRIAVVGLAGRFPGAPDLDDFWRNLRDGVESITFYSDDELRRLNVDPAWLNNPSFVRARPYLEGRELFDAGFFGYSAQEAEIVDPQQRLFLETSWEALEHAGYAPDAPGAGDGLVGVYGGSSQNTYLWFNLLVRPGFFERHGMVRTIITNGPDYLATRTAYKLNLRGPGITVQTACSTSLVAVHLACQGLLNFECDMALAGGVSLRVTPIVGYLYEAGGLLSRDGHCRAFDARATGTLFGDGVGVVVLKRFDDAVRDRDTIHAVILGSAVNNDGSLKAGFTAPAPGGQSAVVFSALEGAGVSADSISYVEAHGTGTELGDPIEVAALTKAFRATTARRAFCAIGSVKTNIGHLDAAAGVAGLIKTVLALEHRELPPSLHYEAPNPNIDFAASPFYVNAARREWTADAGPRRAGVSAFGIGGTNAHVVLEEAPPEGAAAPERPAELLVLSARSEVALGRAASRLASALAADAAPALGDAAWTLTVGRRAFPFRLAVVAHGNGEAAARLSRLDAQTSATGVVRAANPPVAFLFPGQGSQYPQMTRGLYDTVPRFRARVDELCGALAADVGWDLRDVLYPAADREAEAAERLRQTEVTQPALFVVELALAELLRGWGVRPAAMLGHSIGEYVAATIAGVFDWRDALRLVAARGALIQPLEAGVMLAVPMSETAVAPMIASLADLSVAVVNAPEAAVVAGPESSIALLESALATRGVLSQRVATSHAFHSAMMAPIVDAFAARVAAAPRAAPSTPWISNLTGTWITPEQATDPAYWAQHLRQPVRFADGVATLASGADLEIVEVGPGRTLGGFVRRHPAAAGRAPRAAMRAESESASDLDRLLLTLGQLWADGVDIDWAAYWDGGARRRVPLPTYPFERQRYWSDPLGEAAQQAAGARPLLQGLGAPAPLASANLDDVGAWFSVPIWRQSPSLARSRDAAKGWLVIRNDDGFGRHVENALASRGEWVVTLDRAATFTERSERAYALRFDEPADYLMLFERLRARGRMPDRVVCSAAARSRRSAADETLDRDAFFVPLALVQALATDPSPVRIAIVTANAYEAIGGDGALPEGALAGGVARVTRRELPHLTTRVVDLPLVDAPSTAWPALARSMFDEFDIDDAVPVVAYRSGRRWVQEFEAVPFEPVPTDRVPLKPNGAYLVTGGLGGLGLAVAGALAKPGARLALVARTPLPPRDDWPSYLERSSGDDRRAHQIRAVLALEASGAKVMTIAADVSDRASIGAAVSAARAAFGHFAAVIHAAGVAGGGLIALKTREAAAGVLAPKVRGTRALLTALEGDFPDIVVLFSSIAAVTGDIGQVDYASANACLDAVAQSAAARGRRIVSIGWDAWQSVGMAVETEVSGSLKRQRADAVSRGITPERGVDALFRVLSQPFAHVVVSPPGLASRLAEAAAAAGLVAATTASAAARHARPDLATPYLAARTKTEADLVAVWEDLLGADGIGVNDNFFELGGDSLLATQLIARLRAALGRECSLRDVMSHATVASLAATFAAPAPAADRQAALLAELDTLTDEEAEARLRALLDEREV